MDLILTTLFLRIELIEGYNEGNLQRERNYIHLKKNEDDTLQFLGSQP